MNYYGINPLDFGWHHLSTVKETVARMAASDEAGLNEIDDLIALASEAEKGLAKVGWEGDGELHVFWLPDGSAGMEPAFIVKQSNNGGTFIASPIPIPHYDQFSSLIEAA